MGMFVLAAWLIWRATAVTLILDRAGKTLTIYRKAISGRQTIALDFAQIAEAVVEGHGGRAQAYTVSLKLRDGTKVPTTRGNQLGPFEAPRIAAMINRVVKPPTVSDSIPSQQADPAADL